MAASYVYTPVVKFKRNDLKALARLPADALNATKPLIEIPRNVIDGNPRAGLTRFVDAFVKQVPAIGLCLDFYWFEPGLRAFGTHALVAGFGLLAKKGRRVTPTYGFGRGDEEPWDDDVWTHLRAVVEEHKRGFAFRVDARDLDEQAEETWEQISRRSHELELKPNQVDVLVDLRDLRGVDEDAHVNCELQRHPFTSIRTHRERLSRPPGATVCAARLPAL